MNKSADRRGFTLIELLVVIAIIGILSSVVLASLNSARKKGRDAARVAAIKQLQLALELYYDAHPNTGYPATLATGLVSEGFISVIPTDPQTGNGYAYAAIAPSGSVCTSYHIGAQLETDNSALDADGDSSGGTACTGSAADFNGLATDGASGTVCAGTAGTQGSAGTETCFDAKQ